MKPDIDISHLSPAESILLAEELWDRARTHPDAVHVPAEHLAEIERRDLRLSLDATLEHIARYPDSCAKVASTVRRALLRRFPYAVY